MKNIKGKSSQEILDGLIKSSTRESRDDISDLSIFTRNQISGREEEDYIKLDEPYTLGEEGLYCRVTMKDLIGGQPITPKDMTVEILEYIPEITEGYISDIAPKRFSKGMTMVCGFDYLKYAHRSGYKIVIKLSDIEEELYIESMMR